MVFYREINREREFLGIVIVPVAGQRLRNLKSE